MRCHVGYTGLVLCGLLFTGLPSTAMAAGCTARTLSPYIGKWRGKGNWQAYSGGEIEQLVCKISITVNDSGMRIATRGKCVSVRGTSQVGGWLECRKGKLFGPLFTLKDTAVRYLSNVAIRQGGLLFKVRAVDEVLDKTSTYTLKSKIAGKKLSLRFSTSGKNNKSFHAAQMTLKKSAP